MTPWAVLPVELLHGVTFGLAWAAGTINCARISPPGLETSTQAIFQVKSTKRLSVILRQGHEGSFAWLVLSNCGPAC